MPEALSPELLEEAYKILMFFAVVVLIIWVLFANTVRSTLKLIAPDNLAMLPNQAWLLVIPFFNIYWNFEVARRLSNSLNNEFFDRKIEVEENPGMRAGMFYAWTFLFYNFPFPAFMRLLGMIVGIVYFISYWYKINEYRELIIEHNKWRESQNDKIDQHEN